MRLPCVPVRDVCEFEKVALQFHEVCYSDAFFNKNNKTVGETITHHRYSGVRADVLKDYSTSLALPLGSFLRDRKLAGDPFYRRFLNRYGDAAYSVFGIADKKYRRKKGIYAYILDGRLMYVGRCRDSMAKRIDQGYGKIHPKNCFIDGQATNCHLNSLITAARPRVELWLCSIDSDEEISAAEQVLIQTHRPPWNIQY